MLESKTLTFACILGLGALASSLKHEHATLDCNSRISLCEPVNLAILPDEPAREPAPRLIVAPPVASYTSSAPATTMVHPFRVVYSTGWRFS